MTAETAAASRLITSAGPGQFDLVADNVQRLGAKALDGSGTAWLDDLKQQQLEATLKSGGSGEVNHPLVEPLKAKLQAYHEKTVVPPIGGNSANKKVASRIVVLPGSSAQQVIVATYAEKIDVPNLNNGYWKSTWTVEGGSGGDSATIFGTVEIRTLSHEEGNTQLKTNKKFESVTVTGSDLGESLFHQIVTWENEMMETLEGLHPASSESLRQIRRVLPITKTKMKWEVAVQRGVKHLKKTAGKK